MQSINWADFEGQYVTFEKGEQKRLVLANWRQETRSYDDDKTEKPVIVFDVLKINNEEYGVGNKIFCTGAKSFVSEARPLIEEAEGKGLRAIEIVVKYTQEKRYMVMVPQ